MKKACCIITAHQSMRDAGRVTAPGIFFAYKKKKSQLLSTGIFLGYTEVLMTQRLVFAYPLGGWG